MKIFIFLKSVIYIKPINEDHDLFHNLQNKKPGTTGYPGALGHEITRGMIDKNINNSIFFVKQNRHHLFLINSHTVHNSN
jgi:hypothetical protein